MTFWARRERSGARSHKRQVIRQPRLFKRTGTRQGILMYVTGKETALRVISERICRQNSWSGTEMSKMNSRWVFRTPVLNLFYDRPVCQASSQAGSVTEISRLFHQPGPHVETCWRRRMK
ncbi:hypothetical protein Bbelb_348610 [Branchiostoma belcheri]|nr:hypothetical protein Bbelb_348610 [Branchiostoma belcheri]